MTFRDFPIKSLARFIMIGNGKGKGAGAAAGEGDGTAGDGSRCSMNGSNFSAINSKIRNFPLCAKANEEKFQNALTLSVRPKRH